MKKIISFFLVLFTIMFLSACTPKTTETVKEENNTSLKTEEAKTPQVIKVGILAPLIGGAAGYGQDALNAYNMIVDAYNQTNTPKIEFIIEDSKCEGKAGTNGYNKLADIDKVEAIIGPFCSSAVIPPAKINESKKIPMLAPVASSPEISEIGEYIHRYYNDLNAGEAVSDYMEEEGGEEIAIIVENTDYGVGYLEAVKSEFDGEVVFEEKFDSNEKDFSLLAEKFSKEIDAVDFLVFVPNNESTALGFLKALESAGLLQDLTEEEKLIGSEVLTTPAVLEGLGKSSEGFISTKLIDDSSLFPQEGQDFLAQFKENHTINMGELFVVLEGESISLLVDAIKAGNYESASIHNYIIAITEENPREGLFGPYYFDGSDAIGLEFLMGQVRDGVIQTIE